MQVFLTVIVPLITFGLGVVTTLMIRHLDRRRVILEYHANEIADAATNWHQRIYELLVAAETAAPDEFRRLVYQYEQNRIDLPRLQRSLAALEGIEKANSLRSIAERFMRCHTFLVDETNFFHFCSAHVQLAGTASRSRTPVRSRRRPGQDAGQTEAPASETAVVLPRESACKWPLAKFEKVEFDPLIPVSEENEATRSESHLIKVVRRSDAILQELNREVGRIGAL